MTGEQPAQEAELVNEKKSEADTHDAGRDTEDPADAGSECLTGLCGLQPVLQYAGKGFHCHVRETIGELNSHN